MKKKWMGRLAAGLLMGSCFCLPAAAEEGITCFASGVFGDSLQGICILEVPVSGRLQLGSRILGPGDVLTAEQLEKMTYRGEKSLRETLTYLPIDKAGVQETAVFSLFGEKNQEPIAEDSLVETYKNISRDFSLAASDPEGEPLAIEILRSPLKGTLEEKSEGRFCYHPKKNKVGMDFFTYRARNPQGGTSREANVTIHILKPSEDAKYWDTENLSCEFTARWMAETGIFQAEKLGDTLCFRPETPVSQGEFLTMLVKTLNLSPEPRLTEVLEELPKWLRPYGAAALRAGLPGAIPKPNQVSTPIMGAEAAEIAAAALDLPIPVFGTEGTEDSFGWNAPKEEPLTRAQAAELCYAIHQKKQQ